ncbi:hypothetical protein LAZ67_20002699 [Cordylochernes scorpioides]|uniref:Uncharacterized protein n=1 Tax=Cordylochernes scorpioides TaxID=51811 RepID=A0ABY6LKX0_9ARAC|nr:hypothetical protein LAZ67_20002699 [Cordylochernes scorpioides]
MLTLSDMLMGLEMEIKEMFRLELWSKHSSGESATAPSALPAIWRAYIELFELKTPQISSRHGSNTYQRNASVFVVKTGSTTQWQATDLAPKEMAASDMRNRRHVQPLLTWSTNAAHPVSLD